MNALKSIAVTIVAEIGICSRPRRCGSEVPVEILRLYVKGEQIGQEAVQGSADVARRAGVQVGGGVQRRTLPSLHLDPGCCCRFSPDFAPVLQGGGQAATPLVCSINVSKSPFTRSFSVEHMP